MTPPIIVHQEIPMGISHMFYRAARRKRLAKVPTAPVGVKLGEQNLVEPDMIYVARDHGFRIKMEYVDGPPDIDVEILFLLRRALRI